MLSLHYYGEQLKSNTYFKSTPNHVKFQLLTSFSLSVICISTTACSDQHYLGLVGLWYTKENMKAKVTLFLNNVVTQHFISETKPGFDM